jgi:hypothetical protein
MRSLRTWEGPCASARGLLACVLRSENLHHRHARVPREQDDDDDKLDIQPRPTPGASKLYRVLVRDRCPSFARNKSKSNRESPPGWGVGQKSDATIAPDRRPSHSRIFFRRAGFSGGRARASAAIHSTYQWLLSAVWVRRAYLFSFACEHPGGRSKVWGLFIPDRWARRTHLFLHFRNIFFSTPGSIDPLRKNRREIQGGG